MHRGLHRLVSLGDEILIGDSVCIYIAKTGTRIEIVVSAPNSLTIVQRHNPDLDVAPRATMARRHPGPGLKRPLASRLP